MVASVLSSRKSGDGISDVFCVLWIHVRGCYRKSAMVGLLPMFRSNPVKDSSPMLSYRCVDVPILGNGSWVVQRPLQDVGNPLQQELQAANYLVKVEWNEMELAR